MARSDVLTRLKRVVGPYGLVNDLKGDLLQDADRQYYLYRARINSITRSGLISPPLTGFGFSSDEGDATLKAICEALERFCGVNFSPSSVLYAPWEEVAHRAVDPVWCIGFSDTQFESKAFPFRPFDPSATHEWVLAHHGMTNSEIYVHADLVRMSSKSKLTRTSSIGMAIHSDPELAAESALLELIERDHLALAFWRGDPCPSLSNDNLPDHYARHLESIHENGYRSHCLHLHFGFGVHVALWLAFRSSKLPFFLKGAAAHRDLQTAKIKAFEEMFRSFLYYRSHPFEVSANPQGALKNLVHYQTPDVESRLGFLVGPTVDEADLTTSPFTHSLFEHLNGLGVAVYLVDMGHDFTRGFGLHCVRAIAPGLVKTPLGSEPWQLGSPRLRRQGHPRDDALASRCEPHFFS